MVEGKETILNKTDIERLKVIVNNQYSVNPFLGMIFNALINSKSGFTDDQIDYFLKGALAVRDRAERLTR